MKITGLKAYLCHYPLPATFYPFLQLMAESPNCPWYEYPYKPRGGIPEARDFMLKEPILVDKEGCIHVPGGPSRGVELDMDRIRSYGEEL